MYKNVFVISLLMVLIPFSVFAQEKTAKQIVKKANDILNQETVFAKAKMTIVTTSGKTRELYYDSWSMGKGEKSLIRYTAPRRIKGQAMLMLNHADELWSYFPKTNRTRRLASHAKKQKMQGSDFSYEDMGSGNTFLEDFSHKKLKDEKKNGHNCYKIEMTVKKDVDSNYSRMISWIDKETYVIWQMDYYDEKDTNLLLKTLTQSDVEVIDGIPTPKKMNMHNHLDNTDTKQELLEVKYNTKIDTKLFTEEGLKK